MKLSLGTQQAQKQSQKLVLTAQMKESLKILQMPLPELKSKVENEITENPVLEYLGPAQEGDGIRPPWLAGSTPNTGGRHTDENFDPFYAISKKDTFYDFLRGQLYETNIPRGISEICGYIIENIDSRGYLTVSAEEIAEATGAKPAHVAEALRTVRQFDPPGVCAQNLSDCLTLQLGRLPGCDVYAFEIAGNYLKLLSENKITSIAKELCITAARAQSCCNIIKSLNPIPASGYDTGGDNIFVVPEAEIFKGGEGKLKVKNNGGYMPKVYINSFYLRLAKKSPDKETEKYLKEKIKRASVLILEISNREKTITRILEKIIELQPQYFEKGPKYLKPMALKDIADTMGVNESTVCRAVQGKYILCPNGVVSVRSLFTNRVGGSGSSAVSVQNKIIDIFKSEDRLRPLSDQAVVSILSKDADIKISRRTVAKYRQLLMIPPASKRKVFAPPEPAGRQQPEPCRQNNTVL